MPGQTGVGEHGECRVPRELGRPCRLHRDCRLEHRLTNSRLIHSSVPCCGGTNRGRTMVSPSEGNEVRRNGRQGVGASRSTAEPGEPPEGPWGGKGTPSYEPLEGNMTGTPRPEPVAHETTADWWNSLVNRPDMAFTNSSASHGHGMDAHSPCSDTHRRGRRRGRTNRGRSLRGQS